MTAATATTVAQLASLILAAAENKPESVPNKDILFISIAGIAGSGKTTLASKLVDEMNKTLATCGKFDSSSYKIAQHVSMDGYHFPKARLKEFEVRTKGRRGGTG